MGHLPYLRRAAPSASEPRSRAFKVCAECVLGHVNIYHRAPRGILMSVDGEQLSLDGEKRVERVRGPVFIEESRLDGTIFLSKRQSGKLVDVCTT